MGSPVSPVTANIDMEYFEIALGPQCPISIPWWERHVGDGSIIVKNIK